MTKRSPRATPQDHVNLLTKHAAGMRPHRAFEAAVAVIFHRVAFESNAAGHSARQQDVVATLEQSKSMWVAEEYAPKLYQDLLADQGRNRDLLGQIAGHLGSLEKSWGQFFTPWDVCQLISEINIDRDGVERAIAESGYVSIMDCAVGSGALLLAAADRFEDFGVDVHRQLFAEGTDIDPLARMMCFLQLSARGVPARVILGNSLTLETSEVSYTAWMRNLPARRQDTVADGQVLMAAE